MSCSVEHGIITLRNSFFEVKFQNLIFLVSISYGDKINVRSPSFAPNNLKDVLSRRINELFLVLTMSCLEFCKLVSAVIALYSKFVQNP